MLKRIFLLGFVVLSVSVNAADSIMETEDPVLAIRVSDDNSHCLLLSRNDEKNALAVFRLEKGKGTDKKFIAAGKDISDIAFCGKSSALFTNDGKIMLYDLRESGISEIEQGRNPIASPDGKKVLFKKQGLLYLKNLNSNVSARKFKIKKGACPSAWLSNDEFIYALDGSLYKSDMAGKSKLILKGDPLSPWFTGCAISPDGRKLIAFSDDTKANVGEGAKSIWLLDLKTGKSEKLLNTPFCRWLDNENIIVFMDSELFNFSISSRKSVVLCKDKIEAYTVSGGCIFAAAGIFDDIGLYEKSRIFELR